MGGSKRGMVKRIILQYPHAARVLALQYPHAGRTLCITKQTLSYASGQKGEGKLNRSRNTDELKAGRCWFCPGNGPSWKQNGHRQVQKAGLAHRYLLKSPPRKGIQLRLLCP